MPLTPTISVSTVFQIHQTSRIGRKYMKIVRALLCLALAACLRASAQSYDTNGDFVQTFAGSGFSGYVDGQGTQTMFNNPSQIVADSSSNLFVLDVSNSRVRKITPGGLVSTFVGGGNQWPTGSGTNASLIVNGGASMAIDHSNVIWIATGNGYLIRVGPDQVVSNTLLSGTCEPAGICVDSSNNAYVSDYCGNKIWRYRTNGTLEVFAGSGNQGSADGNGIFTSFFDPSALAADAADNIYVYDFGSGIVRRINQNRDVVTIAGHGRYAGELEFDGVGTNSVFWQIYGMCVDDSGSVILACGDSVRRMDARTNVTTMAGEFNQDAYVNDVAGNVARFNGASGVCLSGGVIYVADASNQRIREITFNPSSQPVLPANLQLNTYAGLQITGTVGRTYQIQSSSDMSNWVSRAAVVLTGSPYLWIDQNPVAGSKFYRTLLLP
jgi:hypothetical protein